MRKLCEDAKKDGEECCLTVDALKNQSPTSFYAGDYVAIIQR